MSNEPVKTQSYPGAARVEAKIEELHLRDFRRHIFLCVGGDCAPPKMQQEAWKFLKARLREMVKEARKETDPEEEISEGKVTKEEIEDSVDPQ